MEPLISALTQNAKVRGHFWKIDAYECLEENLLRAFFMSHYV